MKYTLAVVALLSAQLAMAAAPESIAGRVFRETTAIPSLRMGAESTILFQADGRFLFLKYACVTYLLVEFGGRVVVTRAPGDGTYTYRRTGEASAEMTLAYDNGQKEVKSLVFSRPDGGGSNGVSFSFSDAALLASAPAINVSLRGGVTPGHPLIAGFVVPGSEPAESSGANTRDVLIRVVGPSLSSFGVTGVWADPDFQLMSGRLPARVREFQNSDWSRIPNGRGGLAFSASVAAGYQTIFGYLGAFPLLEDSKDAATIVRLPPGAYTIVAAAAEGDAGGEAMIEVYFLP